MRLPLFGDNDSELLGANSHVSVLDAYGHLSVRNPHRHDTFFMPRNMAPALISSAEDILEYFVDDAAPVDPFSPDGYVERFIHSEIYRKHPEVQSVVHSHAPSVLPYTITGSFIRIHWLTHHISFIFRLLFPRFTGPASYITC